MSSAVAIAPSTIASWPSSLSAIGGRSGVSRSTSRSSTGSRTSACVPIPPPRMTRCGSRIAATVADAVRAARVSRGTFYAEFASKEECFLEAYRYGIDVMVDRIRAAVRAVDGDWVARLRAALRAYLEVLSGEPRFARTHLFEVHHAGARAGAERDAALRERPELAMPSDDALFILAAGVDQLVCARVRAGELERLTDLTDELTRTAVAFLEGAAALDPPNPKNRGS